MDLLDKIGARIPGGPLRWVIVAWAAVAAGSGLLLGFGGLDWHSVPGAGSAGNAAQAVPGKGGPPARVTPGAGSSGVTTVATVQGTLPRYSAPGRKERGTVPATWWQRPSVLPVIGTRPGWVEIRLAQRPNGSTAWVPANDVILSTTPYRIVIDLATTHLMLYKDGRQVLSAPAGVGASDDPTPTGEYFVAFMESPPAAGYGPFVLVTSAHSTAISDWSGSGDAVIGIHGPLGDDSEIGTSGARISHGCIRLHLADQRKLAEVPAGTPIDIVK
jgi:lipoprotein-anchoring transpeptidase ErfK/SrfK